MPGLFDDVDQLNLALQNLDKPKSPFIGRGSLVSFHYPRSWAVERWAVHDPYPLVIISDIFSHNKTGRAYVRGVNLHYIPIGTIRDMLASYGENPNFAYHATIKFNQLLKESFRMYNMQGVQNLKKLDIDFMLMLLRPDGIRSFNAAELKRIEDAVNAQIRARLQARAEEMNAYEQYRQQLINQQQIQANMPSPQIQPQNIPAQSPQVSGPTLNKGIPSAASPQIPGVAETS